MNFSARLKQALRDANMKQYELAEKVGVSYITISRYVCGERMPRAQIVALMAKALGVTTDYLLGVED